MTITTAAVAGAAIGAVAYLGIKCFAIWWVDRICKEPEPKNPCPRCRTENLDAANFCRGCGLMLVSHYRAEAWMLNQRDMLRARNRLSTVEAPNGH